MSPPQPRTSIPPRYQAKNKASVHQSMIYRWIKDLSKLETIRNNSQVRRIGAGKKTILSLQVEKEILDWIADRNQRDFVVSFKLDYCLAKYPTCPCKFTTVWFSGFKKRHSLSLRRVTFYSHRPKDNQPDTNSLKINLEIKYLF
jgi:hypothetical protein